jgi:hypothetical protein
VSPATGKAAKPVPVTDDPVCQIEVLTAAAAKHKGKGAAGRSGADKRPVPKCGTVRSYNEGCRGDACVQAMRDYRRERAAQDA